MNITPEDIKAFRKSLGLGQIDFSLMLGMANRAEHISRMEKGRLPIPMHTQVLIHVLKEVPKARKIAMQIAGISRTKTEAPVTS
jgi:predicted transcriptional regulator